MMVHRSIHQSTYSLLAPNAIVETQWHCTLQNL